MGKRELVLIAVFVVLGIGVYQLTAPPPPAGSEGISFSGIFRNMKREIQGSRESATADSQQTVPVDAALRELRVNVARNSDITLRSPPGSITSCDTQSPCSRASSSW